MYENSVVLKTFEKCLSQVRIFHTDVLGTLQEYEQTRADRLARKKANESFFAKPPPPLGSLPTLLSMKRCRRVSKLAKDLWQRVAAVWVKGALTQ